jgi:integrase
MQAAYVPRNSHQIGPVGPAIFRATNRSPEGDGLLLACDLPRGVSRRDDREGLIFPSPTEPFSLAKLRSPKPISKEFPELAKRLGFPGLPFHDLRGTHETLLVDAGVPVHVVAARCGHDPAVLLRSYAKRTRNPDTSTAAIIGAMSKAILAP